MKVTPVSSVVTAPAVDGQTLRLNAIKMKVNNTPSYTLPPEEEAEVAKDIPITDDTGNNKETTATTEATEPLSPQFAALAKQRRALQVKERELLNLKKELESKSQGSDQIPLSRLKSEPLKVLLESGVTFDQLTEAVLSHQSNPELNALKSEMSSFKEDITKKFEDNKLQERRQVLAEMRRNVDGIIATGDDFELVRTTRSAPHVMRLIERTYDDTGEILDEREACKLVEDELFKRNQELAKTKKLQGLFQKPAEPAPAQSRPGIRTLKNSDTASVPMDRKARALAAALGTLKK